eukprot:5232-Amphidinium_carterae.1
MCEGVRNDFAPQASVCVVLATELCLVSACATQTQLAILLVIPLGSMPNLEMIIYLGSCTDWGINDLSLVFGSLFDLDTAAEELCFVLARCVT